MFVWKLACIFPFIFTWLEQWQRVLCFSLTNVPSSIIIYLRHHPVLSRHSQRSWFADSGESKPLEVVWLRAETVCVWERVLWVGESWRWCEGEWEVLWSRGRADGGEGGGLGWGRGGRGDSSVHLHFIQALLTFSQWGCQSTGGRETHLDVVSDQSQAVLDTFLTLHHWLRHQVRPRLPSSQPGVSSGVVGLAHHVVSGVEGSSDVDVISQTGLTDTE